MDADDSLERLAGEDQGETAVHAAHMQYTAACCALRAAIALCLEAFVEGHVTAATLGRACRTSLADPKKVIPLSTSTSTCYVCLSWSSCTDTYPDLYTSLPSSPLIPSSVSLFSPSFTLLPPRSFIATNVPTSCGPSTPPKPPDLFSPSLLSKKHQDKG